ncbi:MAG: Na(+)-translocating NADH-quinone reductase subunit A [Planctomycetota bacterium]|nr:Na(+)-translocating NADH-quinone reductase subunit A [Planctomycetota bacterium]
MIRIRRGLDLDIPGAPGQRIEPGPLVSTVALLGADTVGLRPALAVAPGDRVRTGQLLFTDKRNPGVRFTAPGCGEIVAVHRGARRSFLSVVVRLDGDDAEEFDAFAPAALAQLDRTGVRDQLVASGLWTALRARPFGTIPAPDTTPASLFVTAIDTDPLAPDPALVLQGRERDFRAGLTLLTRLTDGPVRLCRAAGATIPGTDVAGVEDHEFAGPHPAGLPGTHIHFLDPVDERRTVWHVGYQDVAAIGALFLTGGLPTERVVALAGPMVERPRLVRTRLGASTDDLLAGGVPAGAHRVVSGSVLTGRMAAGPIAFVGRHHRQVCVLSDDRPRQFLAWLRAGRGRSAFTTAARGDRRAILPLRTYEKVMPLDVLPTPLLRALEVRDIERAIELGCLELDEEDVALLSYVCPGKGEFGADLRAVLAEIEKDR